MTGGWDERYRAGEGLDRPAHPLIVRFSEQLAPGRALDLACGPGRNALELAICGWRVTAVDFSRVAIEMLDQHARERGLSIETRVADLECGEFAIEAGAYDLICDCNYLQRDLFPAMRAGVRPGGVVIAAIPMVDDSPGLKPMNEKWLVKPGELRGYFGDWEILHYCEENPNGRRVAELVAVRK